MPTLSAIRAQISALPHRYVFFTRKEIRALPKILEEDERVLALASGMMEGVTWLAVCTHKRLIFLHRGMIFGLRQVQLPLDRVQSIDHTYAILFGAIRVWDGASQFTLRWVLKSSIEPFVRTAQEAITLSRRGGVAATAEPVDIPSQLGKLASLYERGYLSSEEFERQKEKILGG